MEAAKAACRNVEVPSAVRPALITALANVVMSSPAHAGVLFDFNLTLPIIMGQFLILMVILDKVAFGPVGEVLNTRDAEIRGKIDSSTGDEEKILALQAEAKKIKEDAIRESRADFEAAEKAKMAEINAELDTEKAKLDKEMVTLMANLAKKEEESREGMKSQVDKLSDTIADKILTEGDVVMDADNAESKKAFASTA
jgi:F-type H+-transporting ATPase subunit b